MAGGPKKKEIPDDLKKYHKMLTKMRIPASAVQNKMRMDGIDPARICEIDGSGGAKKKEIPEELKKYHKMLTKMKIPASAVKNKMRMDGIDPARICEIDGSSRKFYYSQLVKIISVSSFQETSFTADEEHGCNEEM